VSTVISILYCDLLFYTEHVNEYLRLSASADKQQLQRIKTIFEKKNQKSAQTLAALQKKVESYKKKIIEVEHYGVSAHKQPKEVLKDVGQGLKYVLCVCVCVCVCVMKSIEPEFDINMFNKMWVSY